MISIIVPCYNREKEIGKSLNSVLNSSYRDIEVIVIDDGSTDGTLEVLNSFSKRDSRIIVFSQMNSGPSSARNAGMAAANGKYICFLDSDDYVEPDMYERLLYEAESKSSEVVICGYYDSYQNGLNVERKIAFDGLCTSKKMVFNKIIRQFYDGNPDGLTSVWNKLYSSSFLRGNNILFDTSLHRAEDWWFNMTVFETCQRVSVINKCLYHYWRDSADSLMRKMELTYYPQWKHSKLYLNEKNKCIYHFNVNMNLYYQEQLFTIHSLLIQASARGEDISYILKDNFYNSIIQYDKYTSLIVKFCHIIHKISKRMEIHMYKMLAKFYRRKY